MTVYAVVDQRQDLPEHDPGFMTFRQDKRRSANIIHDSLEDSRHSERRRDGKKSAVASRTVLLS